MLLLIAYLGGRRYEFLKHMIMNMMKSDSIQDDDNKAKASELSLANVGGVFVMLLAGMGLACLIAVFEFIWKSRKMTVASAGDDTVRVLIFTAVMYLLSVR